MTEKEPVKYPYSRYFIYSIIVLVLGWIIISLAFSIGYGVFWEHKREKIVPDSAPIGIRNAAEANECLLRIETFRKELLFNTRLFLTGYRKKPAQSIKHWRQWHENWTNDLSQLGKYYRLATWAKGGQKKDEAAENVLEPSRISLADAFALLQNLSADYAMRFEELYDLHINAKLYFDHLISVTRQQIKGTAKGSAAPPILKVPSQVRPGALDIPSVDSMLDIRDPGIPETGAKTPAVIHMPALIDSLPERTDDRKESSD